MDLAEAADVEQAMIEQLVLQMDFDLVEAEVLGLADQSRQVDLKQIQAFQTHCCVNSGCIRSPSGQEQHSSAKSDP